MKDAGKEQCDHWSLEEPILGVELLGRGSEAEHRPLKDFSVLWGLQTAYSVTLLMVSSCKSPPIWQQAGLWCSPTTYTDDVALPAFSCHATVCCAAMD